MVMPAEPVRNGQSGTKEGYWSYKGSRERERERKKKPTDNYLDGRW